MTADTSPHKKRQQAERRGRFAETLAALFLVLKGYRILARRYKSQRGEIDLIARRGQTLVFIEVKARKTVDDALFSIAYKQRKRIEAASREWLKHHRPAFRFMRFDVVALVPRRLPTHIRDAWRPDTAL